MSFHVSENMCVETLICCGVMYKKKLQTDSEQVHCNCITNADTSFLAVHKVLLQNFSKYIYNIENTLICVFLN